MIARAGGNERSEATAAGERSGQPAAGAGGGAVQRGPHAAVLIRFRLRSSRALL